eukprot:14364056-Alexandrium_andersonii.AAC.1
MRRTARGCPGASGRRRRARRMPWDSNAPRTKVETERRALHSSNGPGMKGGVRDDEGLLREVSRDGSRSATSGELAARSSAKSR